MHPCGEALGDDADWLGQHLRANQLLDMGDGVPAGTATTLGQLVRLKAGDPVGGEPVAQGCGFWGWGEVLADDSLD